MAENPDVKLPSEIKSVLAKREYRLHHYVWHGVRNCWLQLGSMDRQQIQSLYPDWEPPRPAKDKKGQPIRDNDSGEDFLYMHRQMINDLNEQLSKLPGHQDSKVVGWKTLPKPDDKDYPVPDFPRLTTMPLNNIYQVKSREYFETKLQAMEEDYKSDKYLIGVTLGQLGSDIEFTIHSDMHVRWAGKCSVGYRDSDSLTFSERIAPKWDNIEYDWLYDFYASHVNDIFWKIHGWVDDRIEDWKRVHKIEGEIQWKGTWVGPGEHMHHHAMEGSGLTSEKDEPNDLECMAKILDAAGVGGLIRPSTQ